MATISSAIGGTVAILGGRGERLAGRGFRRQLSAEAVEAIREEALAHTADGHPFVPAHPAVAGRALAHPVISPGRRAAAGLGGRSSATRAGWATSSG